MVVDVVGELAIEVAERVVRQGGEVDDRVEPAQVVHGHVAQVALDRRDARQARRVAEGAGAVEIDVEADDLVTGGQEFRHEDGADVAEVTGDEDPHGVPASDDELARDECLGQPARRAALDAAQPKDRTKRVGGEPVARRL